MIAVAVATPLFSQAINVSSYGAACNWNGKTGTDDTAAFQKAADAATATYAKSGKPVEIEFSGNCEITGTVTNGSGVHWRGAGKIVVPHEAGSVFVARDASDVSWDNVEIDVVSNIGRSGPDISGILYISTPKDTAAHSGVAVRNCTINNSVWGISVFYSSGSGSLSDVNISGNTVSSPKAYSNWDGIHVGGKVTKITIENNHVSNRSDAAIALTSENKTYLLSGATIQQNELTDDRIGIDMSGPSNVTIENNVVRSRVGTPNVNPAFRVLVYGGGVPSNLNVIGNDFENTAGKSFAANIDINGYGNAPASNITLTGNTFGAASAGSLYIRANNVRVSGNTFKPGGRLYIDYEGNKAIPTSNVFIEQNTWLGRGTIHAGGNASLMVNIKLAPQKSNGHLQYENRNNFNRR